MFTAPRGALRRALVALVLSVLLLATVACGKQPTGLKAAMSPAPISQAPSGALQEVAPPGGVQQLNAGLNERSPQIEVVAPADNSMLPEGPWTLQLRVQDWPLTDAGPVGLGPHVVVQLDDAPPIRLTSPDAVAAIAMPELRPGSHRVTVYAARPWGEAVKAPGASRQVRLHRVSRNPAALPAPGSAQLIAVSPDGPQPGEPVLLDWLLLDAPLQHLRGDDAQWRLRVSVNGDSFLVDRQTPLWLKGFKRGSNAVQLELLDGRGDPLNPPFNSLVREVVIGTGNRPAWLKASLTADEMARLNGETPPEPEPTPEPAPEPVSPPAPDPEPATKPEPIPAMPASEPAATAPATAGDTPTPEPAEPTSQAAEAPPSTAVIPAEPPAPPEPATPIEPAPEPAPEPEPEAVTPAAPAAAPATATATATAGEPAMSPPPLAIPSAPERIAPATSLVGSARDQVRADGSLLQPKSRGPLAGLREKLGG